MVGEAARGFVAGKMALGSEKDISTLRGPMEVVIIWVERMIRRILTGIGLIGFGAESDGELQGPVASGGEGSQFQSIQTFGTRGVDVAKPVFAAEPSPGRCFRVIAKQAGA